MQLAKVAILFQLLKHDLLLWERPLHIPQLVPVALRDEYHLSFILNRPNPRQRARRVATVALGPPNHVPLNRFFDNERLQQVLIIMPAYLRWARCHDTDPIIEENDLLFAI